MERRFFKLNKELIYNRNFSLTDSIRKENGLLPVTGYIWLAFCTIDNDIACVTKLQSRKEIDAAMDCVYCDIVFLNDVLVYGAGEEITSYEKVPGGALQTLGL